MSTVKPLKLDYSMDLKKHQFIGEQIAGLTHGQEQQLGEKGRRHAMIVSRAGVLELRRQFWVHFALVSWPLGEKKGSSSGFVDRRNPATGAF